MNSPKTTAQDAIVQNDGKGRPTATAANWPGSIQAALGIALTLVVLQGMRITTLAGIYPTDITLIARHGLAVLSLALCLKLAMLRGKKTSKSVFDSTAGFAACSVLLSLSLFMKYSEFIFGSTSAEIEVIGKIFEEGLVCTAIVFWGSAALKAGPQSLGIFALGCLIGSGIQLVLSFLQQVPCMIAISCMPLVSAGLFARCRKTPEGPHDETRFDAPDALNLDNRPKIVAYLVTTFCMSFVLGNIIFSSLETQNAASSSPVFQLSIIAGNALAGAALLSLAPKLRKQQTFIAFLLGSTALSAFALYLSTFLSGQAVVWYLAVASLSNNAVHALAWIAPFAFRPERHRSNILAPFITAYGAFFSAKLLSAICMYLAGGGHSSGYSMVVSFALICFFAAALALMYEITQTQDSQRTIGTRNPSPEKQAEQLTPAVEFEPTAKKPESAEAACQASQSESGKALPDKTQDEPRRTSRNPVDKPEKPKNRPRQEDATAREDKPDPTSEPESRSYFKDSISQLASECHLTKQETKVLSLVARGMNAKSIADDLTLSTNTVKSHMRNLYAKLGVHSQQEVISLIRKNKK